MRRVRFKKSGLHYCIKEIFWTPPRVSCMAATYGIKDGQHLFCINRPTFLGWAQGLAHVSQCLPLLGQDCSDASIRGICFNHISWKFGLVITGVVVIASFNIWKACSAWEFHAKLHFLSKAVRGQRWDCSPWQISGSNRLGWLAEEAP